MKLYTLFTHINMKKHEEIDDLAKRHSLLTKYEGDMWFLDLNPQTLNKISNFKFKTHWYDVI